MIDVIYNKDKNTTTIELSKFDIFYNEQLPLIVEIKKYVEDNVEWVGDEAKYNLIIKNALFLI